jgi:hypothetical protein
MINFVKKSGQVLQTKRVAMVKYSGLTFCGSFNALMI